MGANRRIRRSVPEQHRVRSVHLGDGLPPIPKVLEELQDMTDVLLGRKEPPIQAGRMTLMEVADAYYARACELTMLIQTAEREGSVPKNSNYYRLRTGELRTFLEMTKRAAELGSRRITDARLDFDMALTGRESAGRIQKY